MSDFDEEKLKRCHSARLEVDRLRKAVVDWMKAEGLRGRLRFNGDAPDWAAYEAAEAVLDKAREEAGI